MDLWMYFASNCTRGRISPNLDYTGLQAEYIVWAPADFQPAQIFRISPAVNKQRSTVNYVLLPKVSACSCSPFLLLL
jgi:hypothetical protein